MSVKVKLVYRVSGLGEAGDVVEVGYKRAGQLISTHFAVEVADAPAATRKKATSKKTASRSTR